MTADLLLGQSEKSQSLLCNVLTCCNSCEECWHPPSLDVKVSADILDRYFGQSVRSPAPHPEGFRFLTFSEMWWLEKLGAKDNVQTDTGTTADSGTVPVPACWVLPTAVSAAPCGTFCEIWCHRQLCVSRAVGTALTYCLPILIGNHLSHLA
jgi:hypothetical protein